LIGWAGDGVTVWLSLGTAPDFARLAIFDFFLLVLKAGRETGERNGDNQQEAKSRPAACR
jgi:hypothetical protein